MGDVGAVASLLEKVFGFVVDPAGLEKMTREHRLSLIQVAYEIVAVNLYGSTMIESARSNRAIMFQSSPVPVPAGTGVQ